MSIRSQKAILKQKAEEIFQTAGRGYIPIKERTIIPSSHEAIVDEHTWDTVQVKRD